MTKETSPHPVAARLDERRSRVATRLVVAAVAIATLAIVAGCAGHADSERSGHRIASLGTPSASPGSAESTDALFAKYGQPPRERLDETDSESEADQKPFNDCVTDRGGSVGKRAKDTDAQAKAEAACNPLQPLPPVEYDRKNPDALHFVQAVIDCLHTQGVKSAEIAPDDGYGRWNIQFADADAGAGLDKLPACQTAASAASK